MYRPAKSESNAPGCCDIKRLIVSEPSVPGDSLRLATKKFRADSESMAISSSKRLSIKSPLHRSVTNTVPMRASFYLSGP